MSKLAWSIGKEKNLAYLEHALSGVPEYFSGKLHEVPAGTVEGVACFRCVK